MAVPVAWRVSGVAAALAGARTIVSSGVIDAAPRAWVLSPTGANDCTRLDSDRRAWSSRHVRPTLSERPSGVATVLATTTTTESLLGELYDKACAAWPGVHVSVAAFADYVGSRLPADAPAEEALRRIHALDLYLACACADGQPAALAAFDRHCLSVVDRALPRLRVDEDLILEIKQQLRERLLVRQGGPPRIVEFSGRGDLRSWLRVMAVRDALATLRRARKESPVEDEVLMQAIWHAGDAELAPMKDAYRSEFKRAFADALKATAERDRTLLRQHVIDGLGIDELGRLYRVHRATAARWVERARREVLERTRAALMDRLQVAAPELDSIMRLIQSRIEVSVRILMRRRRGKPAVTLDDEPN
jgi:RNA polymerase sigma-70 factor (ECF subfamily)